MFIHKTVLFHNIQFSIIMCFCLHTILSLYLWRRFYSIFVIYIKFISSLLKSKKNIKWFDLVWLVGFNGISISIGHLMHILFTHILYIWFVNAWLCFWVQVFKIVPSCCSPYKTFFLVWLSFVHSIKKCLIKYWFPHGHFVRGFSLRMQEWVSWVCPMHSRVRVVSSLLALLGSTFLSFRIGCIGLVWFNDISTILVYSLLNPF